MSAGDFRATCNNAEGQREHNLLVDKVFEALGGEHDLALHRNQVGQAETFSEDKAGVFHVRRQRVGLGRGSPDIVGWLTDPRGLAVVFTLEIKTGRAVLNPDQRNWHEGHRARGVLAYVVHSVEEARAALADARSRIRK